MNGEHSNAPAPLATDQRIRKLTDEAIARSKRIEPYARVLGYLLLILLGVWIGRHT